VNSEDRKGVVARIGWWAQSHWLQPDGSTCQVYLGIAVATLVSAAFLAMARVNILMVAETLALGLLVASLVKRIEWRDKKLLGVRNVLLDIAFQECRCSPNAIITDSPDEPELVGQPIGKGYCHVCQSRAALKEQFPGAILFRMRELLGQSPRFEDSGSVSYIANPLFLFDSEWGHIPEDLAAYYLTPDEIAWAQELERKWCEAHPAKPQ
jgi:hypothetical protein